MAVACRKNDALEKRCREEGIKIVPLSGNQIEGVFKIGIVGKEFDLIHAHAAKAHTISALSKIFHKKPVIYTRRVDYLPKKNIATNLKYALTDKVVAVSHAVFDVVRSNLNLPSNRIDIVHSVVDPEIERKINSKKVKEIREKFYGKPIIGTAAALTEQKNIPNFIRAARILIDRYPEAKFIVAGGGELRGELQLLINRLNLKEKFKLIGFKRDIYNYIKAFDLFVLPSNNEGFSGSLLNAMMLKVPVVSTDAGGAKEVVANGETGILVSKGNPKALADGISRLLDDKELKRYVVLNAYENVIDNFSVTKMVDAYIEVYDEVIEKNP